MSVNGNAVVDLDDSSPLERVKPRLVPALAEVINVRSVMLTGIFVLLLFFALYFAAPLLMPITVALLLNMLLSPGVRVLARLGIPQALAAALVLLGTLGILIGAVFFLASPAQEWLGKLPDSFDKIEAKLESLREPIAKIQEATAQITQATEQLGEQGGAPRVEIERPSIAKQVLSGAPSVLGAIGVVIILLYFLLASGDTFLRKVVNVVPTLSDKKLAVEIVRSIEKDISYYLLIVTIINVGYGACVAMTMYLLGVPNAPLWGALVTVLNYAPYIGSTINLGLITMVSLLTFDTLAQSLLPPAAFFAIAILEGQIITPLILGQRLVLSPVAVFIAMLFWGWLWGIAGALIAVPLLAAIKIVCEKIEPLQPVAEFLAP